MNKKSAIKIIERQIEKLREPEALRNEFWKLQTLSSLKTILGNKSDESIRFSNFRIYDESLKHIRKDIGKFEAADRIAIEQFLNNCIETVRDKGVYREPNSNWLSRWAEKSFDSLITTLIAILCAVSSAGWFLGGVYNKPEKIETLEAENKKLRDSVLSLSSKIPSDIPKDSSNIKKPRSIKRKN